MKRFAATVGMSLALMGGAGACGAEEGRETRPLEYPRVVIQNILGQVLALSSDPIIDSQQTHAGSIGVGETAVARCIAAPIDAEHPRGTTLLVQQGRQKGYLGVYARGTKAQAPKQQVVPGEEELKEQLPEC